MLNKNFQNIVWRAIFVCFVFRPLFDYCNGNGDDDNEDTEDEDEDEDEEDGDDDTEYDGVKESNTGEDVSPADPTVAKLVIVRLRIFCLKNSLIITISDQMMIMIIIFDHHHPQLSCL